MHINNYPGALLGALIQINAASLVWQRFGCVRRIAFMYHCTRSFPENIHSWLSGRAVETVRRFTRGFVVSTCSAMKKEKGVHGKAKLE